MSTVLAVAGPDAGHLHPTLGVAADLVRRGHDVTVATGDNRADLVRAAGCTPLPLPYLATAPGDDFGTRLWDKAGEMAPALVERLDRRPDLVLSDTLTTAGTFVAELLEVPWVEVVPHHLRDPDAAIPPVGLGRLPARTRARAWSDDSIRRRQWSSVALGRQERDRVRRSIGLGAAVPPRARLVCSLPALEYPRSRWPADTHLVGALAWESEDGVEPDVPDGTAPLVLVTESTASGVDTDLGRHALDGLRHTGVRLVVTTAAPLTAWEADCRVGPAAHGPLLDVADVAVGPGGGGFVTKALTRGVPLVVVPAAGDQRETAARVTWAGVGVAVDRPSPSRLRRAVQRVLNDERHRTRAHAVAVDAAARGPAMAGDVVEAVLDGRPLVGHGPVRGRGHLEGAHR